VPSFSTRTIVYKGMLLAHQVGEYYTDLADPAMVSALAMVHQRFSTNTFPTWDLAHPFRFVCHNGEINTLRGNFNWIARARGSDRVEGPRRRPAEAVAADLRRPVRLGVASTTRSSSC
jgi:glutamate synthase (NADPH/NADH) large chain